jgi:hypothetical protein
MKRPKSRGGFLRMCFGQDITPTRYFGDISNNYDWLTNST